MRLFVIISARGNREETADEGLGGRESAGTGRSWRGLDRSPVSEVSVRYGVSRHSVYAWRDRVRGGQDRRALRYLVTAADVAVSTADRGRGTGVRAEPDASAPKVPGGSHSRSCGADHAPSQATVHPALIATASSPPQA